MITQVHDSIIISPQMAPGRIIIAFQSPRIIGQVLFFYVRQTQVWGLLFTNYVWTLQQHVSYPFLKVFSVDLILWQYWSAKEEEIETLNSALKNKWLNLKPLLSEIVNFILIAIILNKIDNFLFSESTKDHLNVNRTLILPREAPGSVGKNQEHGGVVSSMHSSL